MVRRRVVRSAESAETIESLRVDRFAAASQSRLRGVTPFDDPEQRLYLCSRARDPNGTRANALVRRLVSFERAAESAS
jgi:hypothetical protein